MEIFVLPIANIMRAPKEAFFQTVRYVQICSAGSIFIVFYNLLCSIFRGIGDSKTPLFAVIVASVINIFGDLLLVAGFDMGAIGAAVATIAAQVHISFMVIMAIVNSLGVIESAGVGVAERLCGFIMLVPSAFSQAVATFVAQNVEAGFQYLKAYAIDTLLTSFIFVFFGYFNGCGHTTFLDASLSHLGMDYVDLYIYHMWDWNTSVEEYLAGMAAGLSAQ